MVIVPNKGAIGKKFRKEAKLIMDVLSEIESENALKLEVEMEKNG